jgi:hypothetical protein
MEKFSSPNGRGIAVDAVSTYSTHYVVFLSKHKVRNIESESNKSSAEVGVNTHFVRITFIVLGANCCE